MVASVSNMPDSVFLGSIPDDRESNRGTGETTLDDNQLYRYDERIKMQKYMVTEGVSGYYYYHISEYLNFTRSLCGKFVMQTQVHLSTWGTTSHIREKWCSECKTKYDELNKEGKMV